MSNKPIITIPIDDKQFNEFIENFEKFEKKLDAMPDAWKKINESSKSSNDEMIEGIWNIAESMERLSNQTLLLSEHLKNAADAQEQFNTSTREGESGLKKMAKEAKQLGDNIFGIGKFLVKAGAWGLAGITGGFWGADKLSQAAVNNQRDARILGLTTGQYRAYDTDMGRDVGSNTLMNVVDAQHDISKRYWLQHTTGLSQQQIGSMDAGSIAAAVAMAENIYIKNHPNWSMQTIQAAGFTQLGESQSDLLLHGNTPLSEQQRALRQYRSDSRSLDYGNGTVDALYDFNNRLRIAGQHIETDFSDKLSELNRNGALSNFITSLEKDAEILFNGVLTDKNLSSMEAGLTDVATYLGSPEFRAGVKSLSTDIINLATWVAKALGIVSPGQNNGNGAESNTPNPNGWGDFNNWDNPDNGNPTGFPYNNYMRTGGSFGAKDTYMGPYYNLIDPHTSTGIGNLGKLQGLEGQYGLPAGILSSTAFLESSGNKKAVNPTTGAAGAFQFMPSTGQQYGITNPFDFDQESQGAAHYYADLLKMFKGDVRKALAAYDWGQGNVQSDVKKYGADWERHIPRESEDRIVKALTMMSKYKSQQSTVKVVNAAGANIAISTNAAAP